MRKLLYILMIGFALTACSKTDDETQKAQNSAQSQTQTEVKAPASAYSKTAPVGSAGTVATAPAAQDRILVETVFTCADKTAFKAIFKVGKVDLLWGKSKPVTLTQEIAASGFWYRNAQYELRGKGRGALFTVGKRVPVQCTSK